MADNTTQAGSDTIATDDVTTLNGSGSSGVKVQRVKIGYGDDGTYRDASLAFPLPVAAQGALFTGGSLPVAAAGTGTMTGVDVSDAGNVTFTVYNTVAGSAWAGAPVIVFEQSFDNTSWGPLITVRSDNSQVASTHVLPAGTANGSIMFDAAAEGINYVRCRVTTGPTTNGLTVAAQPGGMAFSPVTTTIDRVDAGRVALNLTYSSAAPVVADTLLSFVSQRGATAGSGTTFAASTGKILRIQSVILTLRATAATLPFGLLTMRINYSGAAVIGSPVNAYFAVSGSAAVIGNTGTANYVWDGVDISGAAQIGFSFSNNVTTNVANITVLGYEFAA